MRISQPAQKVIGLHKQCAQSSKEGTQNVTPDRFYSIVRICLYDLWRGATPCLRTFTSYHLSFSSSISALSVISGSKAASHQSWLKISTMKFLATVYSRHSLECVHLEHLPGYGLPRLQPQPHYNLGHHLQLRTGSSSTGCPSSNTLSMNGKV